MVQRVPMSDYVGPKIPDWLRRLAVQCPIRRNAAARTCTRAQKCAKLTK